ncbi:uncharacterized protein LOC131623560 [Vicia villosa]|uniref:uncharacterized protein LOC131623560 n=1 Tax=Vicia villosa TaxID=3911 RepID=UPI00273C03D7|nr:uncharacterized protein LOC131623560 [Vicia villosa]
MQMFSGQSSSTPLTEKYTSGIKCSDDNRPLWAYVTLLQNRNESKGNAKWRCNFCQVEYNGSYFRVKSHLLREKNKGIAICSQVTNEYLAEMQELQRNAQKVEPVQVPLPTRTTSLNPPIDKNKKKRGSDGPLSKAFNNEARDHLSSEIARLFYSAGMSFNVARNPYFISAFTYAANTYISGYIPPSYNAIRTSMLQREKANILKLLQPIKYTWPEKGVSIVTDGWTDAQRRPLINFMATSSAGPMFLKAIDGTGEFKDKHYIAKLILNTIDEVGAQNVVQVITDNAPVSKAAELIVESTQSHIFWTPCVVHTLNLALKCICSPKNTSNNEVAYNECSWISKVADDAFYIRNFILNHSMRFAMYKQFVHLRLLSITETRFASVIILLKRLQVIKKGLSSMVIDEQWSQYKEDDVKKVAFVKETILSEQFWDKIDYILKFTDPIYDMLRSCDTDEPNLHLVYEKWDSMIEEVKLAIYKHEGKELNESSSFHQVVHGILINRWTKSYTPLHCLAHSLNPRYYCKQWLDISPNRVAPHRDNEIFIERNKCIRSYFMDANERLEATAEFVKFSSAEGEFGQFDSLQDRWNLKESLAPKLQSIALKLLSQPTSSSSAERNWSTYGFIHSLKRNRLNPKRAEDLVFVHTNLRLLSRKSEIYNEGVTKMWDIGGDELDLFDGAGILEVATLSLGEPELEAAFIGEENIDIQP